jgi:hypothetical protein
MTTDSFGEIEDEEIFERNWPLLVSCLVALPFYGLLFFLDLMIPVRSEISIPTPPRRYREGQKGV